MTSEGGYHGLGQPLLCFGPCCPGPCWLSLRRAWPFISRAYRNASFIYCHDENTNFPLKFHPDCCLGVRVCVCQHLCLCVCACVCDNCICAFPFPFPHCHRHAAGVFFCELLLAATAAANGKRPWPQPPPTPLVAINCQPHPFISWAASRLAMHHRQRHHRRLELCANKFVC